MGTETITVACKLQRGLICRIFKGRQETEIVQGGGVRDVVRYYPTGQQFVLNGTASEAKNLPKVRLGNGMPGDENAQMLDSGFALTFGVPKDLWELWLDANKDADYVQNGLVFAHKQVSSIKAQAKTNENRRTGFEAVDPDAPAPGIEPTDEQKKRTQASRLRAA